MPFQKYSLDFHIRSVGIGNDCKLILTFQLTYFWRSMNISNIFYLLKSTSINTPHSGLMGHSDDDAVHKIPHKIKKELVESAEKFGIGLFDSPQ